MSKLCIKILDKDMQITAVCSGEDEVNLLLNREYQLGDKINIESSEKELYLWLQLDDASGKSLVYTTGNITYQIPFEEKRKNISPKVFYGEKHLLSVKTAKPFEIQSYRNLAVNVYDQRDMANCYPHITANVETRGETVFAAQNAIDGVTINTDHGNWPYQSWGINMQDDAKIHLDFGRNVEIDCIILYTRADFPHDNWWERVSFTFSDGSSLEFDMEKSIKPHELKFERKAISWLEMHDMKKSDDPSPFPALTQIEVYGTK